MTSSSVGVHRHLPHTFILLSLLRALSSSELSAGRIGFTSLVLLWVRAGEGAYYIINPSNFTFRSSISSPLFSRFCFVFIRRRWENNAAVWVCVARRISRTRTGLLLSEQFETISSGGANGDLKKRFERLLLMHILRTWPAQMLHQ